ncbi:hypothetical protein H4R34_001790 [Dimargaris verticillata]|uniref:Uncharacterized protein n=1 Tax=Dimargaris verticillata TaxID=2761393 RepID=A0A9W8B7S1_9FUNG|nr:hypothetical protein H4R34_001790 [Dimargaris verticillata]
MAFESSRAQPKHDSFRAWAIESRLQQPVPSQQTQAQAVLAYRQRNYHRHSQRGFQVIDGTLLDSHATPEHLSPTSPEPAFTYPTQHPPARLAYASPKALPLTTPPESPDVRPLPAPPLATPPSLGPCVAQTPTGVLVFIPGKTLKTGNVPRRASEDNVLQIIHRSPAMITSSAPRTKSFLANPMGSQPYPTASLPTRGWQPCPSKLPKSIDPHPRKSLPDIPARHRSLHAPHPTMVLPPPTQLDKLIDKVHHFWAEEKTQSQLSLEACLPFPRASNASVHTTSPASSRPTIWTPPTSPTLNASPAASRTMNSGSLHSLPDMREHAGTPRVMCFPRNHLVVPLQPAASGHIGKPSQSRSPYLHASHAASASSITLPGAFDPGFVQQHRVLKHIFFETLITDPAMAAYTIHLTFKATQCAIPTAPVSA